MIVCSPVWSTPPQVEGSSMKHDSPDFPHLSNLTDPDMSSVVIHANVNNQSADQQSVASESDVTSVEQCVDSKSVLEHPNPQNDDCNMCGSTLGMAWRRCTHIDHDSPFNICNICYHDGHTHSDHADQLSMYTPKYTDGAHRLCDSCGKSFESKLITVLKCKKCSSYVLCNECFKHRRHKGHVYHMEEIYFGQL